MSTFAEIVRSRHDDDKVGLRWVDDNGGDRSWSWAQVVQQGAERAALLQSMPVPAGRQRHLGLLMENVPDYVFWLCGAALSGTAVIGINPTRRGAELANDIRHTHCDLIVTESRLAGLLDGIDHGVAAGNVHDVDDPGYTTALAPFRGADLPTEPVPAEAILLLLFSSGSTGAPKAVICSQGRLGYLAESLRVRTELTRNSVSYLSMPLFHGNSAMMNFAPSIYAGATLCLSRKFSASGFVRDVHAYGATYANYVGRALSYVLAQPVDDRDADSSLSLVVGTEASAADVERFSRRFGCRVSEGYGLSEGVLRINRTAESPPDALGLPVGGADIRVLDEATGQECPPAEKDTGGRLLNADKAIGQIVGIGMAHLFEGYYNNQEAMADRVRGADFWTGDLAYRDADGQFYFAGRSSDWLRVDSENFAAAPVERIIERWDPVAVALVYAVPDPRTGDQVMCTLQMQPGRQFDADALAAYLEGQSDMGTKWRPRYVRVTEQVPTTGSSKVAKTVLRRAAWATDDPVHVWSDGRYRPFTRRDAEQLEKDFADHGRTALLPTAD